MGAKAPIEVVPNGVDISKIKNTRSPRKSATMAGAKTQNTKVIITTSRLVYKNGVDVLIRAVAELKKQPPKLILKSKFLAVDRRKKIKRFGKRIES